mgnify:FL=1
MLSNSLNVFLNDKHIGTLEKDDNGGVIFQYSNNADRILSLSLPIQKAPFENKQCRGFFNGLLPESEHTRIAIGKKYGINPKNDFSILQAIGYDCAGAVSFFDSYDEQTPSKYLQETYEIDYTPLSENELEKFIVELPQKPLATGVEDMRLSLAGAQDKTSVIVVDGQIGIPKDNVPTSHILKPAINGFNETIENEFICIKTAEKLGIKVPDVKIGYANKTKYFLIQRYDREIIVNKIKRIHQEDFCQASNIPSAYKYQAEGGVDFKRCFEILRVTSQPAVAINQFIQLMIFNYLIGNNDAHGKNFSILHYDNGEIKFAPAYDILCSQVYPELSNKMAMKIGGHYKHDEILLMPFEKLANDNDISFTQLKKVIKNQCETLPIIVASVVNSFDNKIGKDILSVVQKNCTKLLKEF